MAKREQPKTVMVSVKKSAEGYDHPKIVGTVWPAGRHPAYDRDNYETVEHPVEFGAVMKVVGFDRGFGTAFVVWWEDKISGRVYKMRTIALKDVLLYGEWQVSGVIDSTWRLLASPSEVTIAMVVPDKPKRKRE